VPDVVAVVPAAGQSSRFGSIKLIADVGGMGLLDRTLACLLDGDVRRVIVVLSPTAQLDSIQRLADPRVSTVVNPDPSRGMFSSIQVGLSVQQADTYLVLPADMPFVRVSTVVAVARESRRTGAVVLPMAEGRRGHPIGLPGALRRSLLAMDATSNLKEGLAALGVRRVDLPVSDRGILRDIDVPGDLAGDEAPGRGGSTPKS
jgi:molybdenum cofactor cytidylyltransferase